MVYRICKEMKLEEKGFVKISCTMVIRWNCCSMSHTVRTTWRLQASLCLPVEESQLVHSVQHFFSLKVLRVFSHLLPFTRKHMFWIGIQIISLWMQLQAVIIGHTIAPLFYFFTSVLKKTYKKKTPPKPLQQPKVY